MPEVLCAGIIVADHVCTPISHLPSAGELVMADSMLLSIGGCAANTAVDLAKMEVDVAIAGRVGADVFGRVVTDILSEARVDGSCLKTSATLETSQTLIVNVQGQDRRFIHTFGANREFSAADIPLSMLDRIKVLYVGGYLALPGVTQTDLAAVFATARARGVKTMLDIVIPGKADLSQFEMLLPHVDIFLPNQQEAEIITGVHNPLDQAAMFQRLGAGTTIITAGGSGAILVQRDLRLAPASSPRGLWTRPVAAMPSTPATSTACCAAWAPRIACASPALWGQAASAPSAPLLASSPARNARRSCGPMR